VTVDSLDNIYLTGETGSFGAGGDDVVLVKYDSSGVQLWNRTWGGYSFESCNDILVDSIGNNGAVKIPLVKRFTKGNFF
jgi:hypothetical protein